MNEDKRKELEEMLSPALGRKPCARAHLFDRTAQELFLKHYFKTGNMSKAADVTGFDRRTVFLQLQKNPQFKHDFEMVKKAIKHDLEEVMMENAKTPRGYLDRITFLRRHFPEEYNPKIQEAKYLKQDDSRLNKLLDILDAKVIDVNEEKTKENDENA